MEVLGYLHGAIAYEIPETQDKSQGSSDVLFSTIPWQRVSAISLLSLACIFSLSFAPGESAEAALLRHADRSPAVTQLQQGLTVVGCYNGPITGYYGDLTLAAVRQFQQSQGLIVDGIAGPQTLAALQQAAPGYTFSTQSNDSYPATPSTRPSTTPIPANGLSVGSTGVAVTRLQVQLTQAGFYDGPITEYFGPRTQDAVLRFQQANGLPATGVADAQTLTALSQVAPIASTDGTTDGRPFEVNPSQSASRPNNNRSEASSGVSSFNTTGVGSFADTADIGTLLYRGDRGPAVTQLQESLTQIGVYKGPVTGYYGSLTESAVYRFQQLNAVEPTGVAGPVTQQLIESSIQPI